MHSCKNYRWNWQEPKMCDLGHDSIAYLHYSHSRVRIRVAKKINICKFMHSCNICRWIFHLQFLQVGKVFRLKFFSSIITFSTYVWIIMDAVQLGTIILDLFISWTICTSLGMFRNYAKHDKTLFGPHTIIILDYSHSEAQNKVPLLIFIHKCMHTSNNTRWTFTSNLGWWTGIF